MSSVFCSRLESGITQHIRGFCGSRVDSGNQHIQAYPGKNARSSRNTRALVPEHGPSCWQRNISTKRFSIDETVADPPAIDRDEWKSKASHVRWKFKRDPQSHRPLEGGDSRVVLGQQLRKILRKRRENLSQFMDPNETRRLHGIDITGDSEDRSRARKKLHYAAAATATLGKYRGSMVSDQYLQDVDLQNELDSILETKKSSTDTAEFDEVLWKSNEGPSGLKPRKVDVARKRIKPRSLPWGQTDVFERRLARNPYALQLASGVRQDIIGNMRLPSDFMVSLNVKMNRATGIPWVVPADFQPRLHEKQYTQDDDPLSLRAAQPRLETLIPRERGDRNTWTSHMLLEESHRRVIEGPYAARQVRRTWPGLDPADAQAAPPPPREGIDAVNRKVHVLCTPPVVHAVANLPPRWQKFVESRWRDYLGPKIAANLTMRTDMYELVVKLMRRKTARNLAALEHSGQPTSCPFNSQVEVFQSAAGVLTTTIEEPIELNLSEEQNDEVGGWDPAALLWFGESWGDRFPYTDDMTLPSAPEKVLEEPTIPQIPVYNMQQILSKIEYNWLRSLRYTTEEGEHKSIYRSRQVLVRDSLWSSFSLKCLWKLHLTLTSGSPQDGVEYK